MGSSSVTPSVNSATRKQLFNMGQAGSHFVMRHDLSQKYVHILNNATSYSNCPVVFNKTVHDRMIFTFEVSEDDDEYGYIQHVESGKYLRPFGGDTEPAINTPLVIHDDKDEASLFNIDQETNLIKHKSGLHVNPALHFFKPRKNTWLVLHDNDGIRSKFHFVDPNDTDKEVDIPCDSDSGED